MVLICLSAPVQVLRNLSSKSCAYSFHIHILLVCFLGFQLWTTLLVPAPTVFWRCCYIWSVPGHMQKYKYIVRTEQTKHYIRTCAWRRPQMSLIAQNGSVISAVQVSTNSFKCKVMQLPITFPIELRMKMVIGPRYNVAACIQLFIAASPCGCFQMGVGFFFFMPLNYLNLHLHIFTVAPSKRK